MEEYKLIDGLGYFAVSRSGKIKNTNTGNVLTPTMNKRGYYSYTFYYKGNKTNKRIHRLVAETFIENPEHLPYVNHIDGNKKNNHVENLEWCTAKENNHHARRTKLIDQDKAVIATDMLTGMSKKFKSISDAGRFYQINTGTITKVLKGRRNQTHDITFRYAN